MIEIVSTVFGERLDRFLSETLSDLTRTAAANLIKDGCCTVNGKAVNSKSFTVSEGDLITLTVPALTEPIIIAEEIPLDIRYEDGDLLIVNKPRGMVVHPAAGHYSGTLVNALMHHCRDNLSGINGVARPGIVHRLDKDTSGLLLVAKNDKAHNALSEQLKNRLIKKEYHAVVHGRITQGGEVNAPIGRSATDRKKMRVVSDNRLKSREAVTKYEVIANYAANDEAYTYLSLQLITGRTHQIRVHMAYIGHPVAGDKTYGCGKPKKIDKILDGQCLHAKRVGFTHPRSGEYMEVDSELPEYFTKTLGEISKE